MNRAVRSRYEKEEESFLCCSSSAIIEIYMASYIHSVFFFLILHFTLSTPLPVKKNVIIITYRPNIGKDMFVRILRTDALGKIHIHLEAGGQTLPHLKIIIIYS